MAVGFFNKNNCLRIIWNYKERNNIYVCVCMIARCCERYAASLCFFLSRFDNGRQPPNVVSCIS